MFNFFQKHDAGIFVEIPIERQGRLFVSPMPYGPYDTLNRVMTCYRRAKITHAVPLITDEEVRKKCKRNLFAAYAKANITVNRFPFADMTAPNCGNIDGVVEEILAEIKAGNRVVVHCNAGVGRTGIVVACTVCRLFDYTGEQALRFMEEHMHVNLTSEQYRFVTEWRQKVPCVHQ